MTTRPWLLCLLVAAFACDSGEGASGGNLDSNDPSTATPDAGAGDEDDDDDGTDSPADAGRQDEPIVADDAAVPSTPADAGPADPIRDIIDTVTELTTCKPAQVNPVIDCFTKTCAGDLLGLPGCLLEKCAPLIDKLDPKCKECVIAGVNQDTTGLLENCLDTDNDPATPLGSSDLPF